MELHQTLTCLYSMSLAKGITPREDLGGAWGLKHPLQNLLICYITRKIVEATGVDPEQFLEGGGKCPILDPPLSYSTGVVVSKAYTWVMKSEKRRANFF